jgi:hypothetical protein
MTHKPKDESNEVWVNPRSNFFRAGNPAWDRSSDASNARYLELADVALRPAISAPPIPVEHSQDSSESPISQQIEDSPVTNPE